MYSKRYGKKRSIWLLSRESPAVTFSFSKQIPLDENKDIRITNGIKCIILDYQPYNALGNSRLSPS